MLTNICFFSIRGAGITIHSVYVSLLSGGYTEFDVNEFIFLTKPVFNL